MPAVKSCISSRGVVLVRRHAGDRLAPVVQHVQVAAHRGIERDVPHQVAIVAERAVHQHALIGDDRAGVVDVDRRHDPDLVQCPCHALAQLIGAGQREVHEVFLRHLDRLVEQRVGIDRHRRRELIVQERIDAVRHERRRRHRASVPRSRCAGNGMRRASRHRSAARAPRGSPYLERSRALATGVVGGDLVEVGRTVDARWCRRMAGRPRRARAPRVACRFDCVPR